MIHSLATKTRKAMSCSTKNFTQLFWQVASWKSPDDVCTWSTDWLEEAYLSTKLDLSRTFAYNGVNPLQISRIQCCELSVSCLLDLLASWHCPIASLVFVPSKLQIQNGARIYGVVWRFPCVNRLDGQHVAQS